MTVSRASRPTTSALLQPVTRSHARLKRTIRPSASRTQTSVWAVSTSAAPTSWSTDRSAMSAASSSPAARRAPCPAPMRRVPFCRKPLRPRTADASKRTRREWRVNAAGRACRPPVAARSEIAAELLRPGTNECHARVAFDTPDHRDWPPARRPARGPVEGPKALRPSGRSAGGRSLALVGLLHVPAHPPALEGGDALDLLAKLGHGRHGLHLVLTARHATARTGG